MSREWCSECVALHEPERHFPEFRVWCDDDEAGGSTYRAMDAQSAAERWAEDDDAYNDHSIVGGSAAVVNVRDLTTGSVMAYEVTGEVVPSYTARRKG